MNVKICMVQLNLKQEIFGKYFYDYIESEIFQKIDSDTKLVVLPENLNLSLLFAKSNSIKNLSIRNIFEKIVDFLISKLNLKFLLNFFKIEIQKEIILNTMCSLAKKYNVYVASGTYYEKYYNKKFNAFCLIDNQGRIISSYKKYKLLGIEKALGISSCDNPQSIHTNIGRIGLCICYDINDKEYISRICKSGVDYLLCPSNGFRLSKNWPFDKVKERPQVQRSQENGIYVIRPYCAGSLWPLFYFQGHSHATDKNGNTIIESQTRENTELLYIDISV